MKKYQLNDLQNCWQVLLYLHCYYQTWYWLTKHVQLQLHLHILHIIYSLLTNHIFHKASSLHKTQNNKQKQRKQRALDTYQSFQPMLFGLSKSVSIVATLSVRFSKILQICTTFGESDMHRTLTTSLKSLSNITCQQYLSVLDEAFHSSCLEGGRRHLNIKKYTCKEG